MQLPGFLKRDPTEGPDLPEDRAGSGYATRGCMIGCLVALFSWFIPIPVATIVWVFDLKGPFGDYMLMAIPFFLALPIIGAGIAELFRRRHGTNSCE
ncbi:MAG: hypothetical protein ACHRXM_11435 [Isosphaerales bacterium]